MDSQTNTQTAAVGRLAPSPTGALHVGNARSFLLAWLSARQQGGRVYLRIEDIDSPRVKPWAVASTVEDLAWLGLDWDPYPPGQLGEQIAGAQSDREPGSEVRRQSEVLLQSHRLDRYAEVIEGLRQSSAIYPCTCTRSEVAAAASAPHERGLPPLEGAVYPGTCRTHHLHDLSSEQAFAWRFRMQEKCLRWWDGVRGEQSAHLSQQLGDFVIAKGDGAPAYQLAVVVDDHDYGITEIVRGDDLIPSTFRQIALMERLGWSAPNYYHVPLVIGPDGRRLAKRHGDTRLAVLREQGVSPESLVGYLAWTLGIIEQRKPIAAEELIGRLDWGKIPSEPTVFDLKKELPLLRAG